MPATWRVIKPQLSILQEFGRDEHEGSAEAEGAKNHRSELISVDISLSFTSSLLQQYPHSTGVHEAQRRSQTSGHRKGHEARPLRSFKRLSWFVHLI